VYRSSLFKILIFVFTRRAAGIVFPGEGGLKWQTLAAEHSPPSTVEVKNNEVVPPLHIYVFSWRSASLSPGITLPYWTGRDINKMFSD
jgi:hypothetical protein